MLGLVREDGCQHSGLLAGNTGDHAAADRCQDGEAEGVALQHKHGAAQHSAGNTTGEDISCCP